MFYYKYRLIESFKDNDDLIHKIQVISKRKHDNAFNGYIYIVEEDWNIHSLDLTIGRDSQIDFTDSIYIRQVHVPVTDSIRMPLSLHITMYFKVFGFKANTNFIGFFSDYDVNKTFSDKFFNNEVFKVEKESSKRDSSYWDNSRQALLTEEEVENYYKGDSVLEVRESESYKDSITKSNNEFKIKDLLWGGGYSHRNTFKKTSYNLNPLLKSMLNYNLVEGFFININQSFRKSYENRNTLILAFSTKYSFTNKNFYYQPQISYYFDRINSQYIRLEGGLNSVQYNQRNPISAFMNTYYTLLTKDNFAKFYEKKFAKMTFGREILNGLNASSSLEYARRSPLVNNTDFSIIKRDEKDFTSNNPLNPLSDNPAFAINKTLLWTLGLTIKFGQKFATYPDYKQRYGTKFPIINIGYKKAISTSFTDTDYDQWYMRMNDRLSLNNLGVSDLTVEIGGFFNTSKNVFY